MNPPARWKRFVHKEFGWAPVSRKRVDSRFEAIRNRLGGEPALILDVGANKGRTIRGFRQEFPGAEIHAFEPHPRLFEELQQCAATMPRVTVHGLAVGDRAGKVTFHLNRFNANHSLLAQDEKGSEWAKIDHVGSAEVEAVTVDGFCAERGIEAVDLIKIDAEGGDLLVLRGAERMLSAKRLRAICVEMLYVPIFAGQPYHHDISRFLQEKGYRLFDQYSPRYDESGQLRACDGIFFPADAAPRPAEA